MEQNYVTVTPCITHAFSNAGRNADDKGQNCGRVVVIKRRPVGLSVSPLTAG